MEIPDRIPSSRERTKEKNMDLWTFIFLQQNYLKILCVTLVLGGAAAGGEQGKIYGSHYYHPITAHGNI